MAIPTRIYLTGFMGSGKSTVGPLLAERLGYDYVDLDEAVASAAGKPVQTIFADDGENEFRRIEALKLRAVSRGARIVISLGGGAVTSKDNLYFVTTNGLLIYLRVPIATLVTRLQESGMARPLLMDEHGHHLSDEKLQRRIQSMIEMRERFYNEADIVLDAAGESVEELVDEAVKLLTHPSSPSRNDWR